MSTNREDIQFLTAQEYVDALRKGDVFKILDFEQMVINKYLPIVKTDRLLHNQVSALIIYELSKTDIKTEDLSQLANLIVLLENRQGPMETIKKEKDIVSAISFYTEAVVAMNSRDKDEAMLKDITLDRMKIQEMNTVNSPLIQLRAKYSPEAELSFRESLEKATDRVDFGEIEKEKLRTFNQSFRNHYGVEIDVIPEPNNQKSAEMQLLQRQLTEYHNYLVEKQKNTGENKDSLKARITTISTLQKEISGKTEIDSDVSAKINTALGKFEQNKPKWSERKWLHKLADIATLGVTAAIRGLNSKEAEFKKKLHDLKEPKTIEASSYSHGQQK